MPQRIWKWVIWLFCFSETSFSNERYTPSVLNIPNFHHQNLYFMLIGAFLKNSDTFILKFIKCTIKIQKMPKKTHHNVNSWDAHYRRGAPAHSASSGTSSPRGSEGTVAETDSRSDKEYARCSRRKNRWTWNRNNTPETRMWKIKQY